jgi:hypothetical protein
MAVMTDTVAADRKKVNGDSKICQHSNDGINGEEAMRLTQQE